MPRTARRNKPGALYHVISNFVDKDFFITTDVERAAYLRMLAHGLAQSDWRCMGYAIMSSHLHHAMIAGEMPMMSWTIPAHGTFAQWLNERHRRTGPLFAQRPSDGEVPLDRAGALLAYIHNNPVRAHVVATARQSTWTSHRAYLGLARSPSWLHVDEGLELAGFTDRKSFDAFVRGAKDEFEAPDLRAIRRAARRRGGLNVGTPKDDEVPIVARPFAHVRPDPTQLLATCIRELGVDLTLIGSRRRSPAIVDARRTIVIAAKRLGVCGADIAAALGISEQAVSKLARRQASDPALVRRICESVVGEADRGDRGTTSLAPGDRES